MFKVAVALLVLVVACNGFLANVGSYQERPELVLDPTVAGLMSFAAEKIATSQNLFMKSLKVVRVQTQVVNGMNYKIDFTAEPVNGVSGQTTTCQVVVNVQYGSVQNLVQSQCQTA